MVRRPRIHTRPQFTLARTQPGLDPRDLRDVGICLKALEGRGWRRRGACLRGVISSCACARRVPEAVQLIQGWEGRWRRQRRQDACTRERLGVIEGKQGVDTLPRSVPVCSGVNVPGDHTHVNEYLLRGAA